MLDDYTASFGVDEGCRLGYKRLREVSARKIHDMRSRKVENAVVWV
jgi:hypothetical protein